jgi:hypothetical protein
MEFEKAYTDKEITPWGGMVLLKKMLDRIGFRQAVGTCLDLPQPGSNQVYKPLSIIEFFLVSFRFTEENTIVFTLKDENTIELTDYQGAEFTIAPALVTTSFQWDLEKTFKFGGASYSSINQREVLVVFVVISKNNVIFHTELNGKL